MLRNVACAQLDAPDQNVVNGIIGAPITVDYLLTTDARLLVYPTTGTIVSLDHVDQTLDDAPGHHRHRPGAGDHLPAQVRRQHRRSSPRPPSWRT